METDASRNSLATFIQGLRARCTALPYANSLRQRKLKLWWSENDVLQGQRVRAFVILLLTRGCAWARVSGCTMCGYSIQQSSTNLENTELLAQLSTAMKHYGNEEIIKLYTSGSFFDSQELSIAMQEKILRMIAVAKRVIVESRPEFITDECIRNAKAVSKGLMVALGLESANDTVLRYAINKGFRTADYVRAAELLRELNVPVKTYVLIKPPLLTEKAAIEDAVRTAKFASNYSEILSFNPVCVHRGTFVELLWKHGSYHPPWLWSIVKILTAAKSISNSWLFCEPTAGGKERGAHNCGNCDERVLTAIRNFSLTQDLNFLNGLKCDCLELWEDLLELERFAFGSYKIPRKFCRDNQ